MKYFHSRTFWKLLTVFFVLDLCWLMAGCADWESQASSIIALLGPAIQAAIAILAAFGVGVSESVMTTFNEWEAQAQTDLVTLKGLIADYQTALASAQPGILNQIISVVTTTAGNLTTLLESLHITDPTTQSRVAAVFAAISGMLAAIVNLVPAVQASSKLKDGEKLALYEKFKATAKNFKSTFNAAAGVFGKQYEV
jgi:hypothetical protein